MAVEIPHWVNQTILSKPVEGGKKRQKDHATTDIILFILIVAFDQTIYTNATESVISNIYSAFVSFPPSSDTFIRWIEEKIQEHFLIAICS